MVSAETGKNPIPLPRWRKLSASPNQESQLVEFKRAWRDEFLKELCGFANAQGGTLVVGVDDSGKAVGVGNARKLLEDIPNKVVSLLGIVADVDLVRRDGCDTLEIRVKPSPVPVLFHGVCHYRSGTTKQELTGIALQQFILRKMGRSWDDMPCEGAGMEEIDRGAVRYFTEKAAGARRLGGHGAGRMDARRVLESLGLFDGDGKLKNAAVLLFGKNPQKFFPGAVFRIGRFGRGEADLMFQDSVEGNLLQMTDRVVEILRSKYLVSPVHYEGLQRVEPLEIPEDALREAIFNSIIHKDYSGAHIQMKVRDNRVELWNEGKLPEGYTVKKLLGAHASRPRNRNLAAAFYRAGFIEAWGRGIEKIREGMAAAGLPAPLFESTCGGVKVTLFRPEKAESATTKTATKTTQKTTQKTTLKTARKEKVEGTARKIAELMAANPGISIGEIVERTGLTRDGVNYHIRALKTKAGLVRVGGRKAGHWEFKEEP